MLRDHLNLLNATTFILVSSLLLGCVSTSPPRASDLAQSPVSEPAPASAKQGPESVPLDPDAVFSLAPPEGVVGVFVPALVTEPAVRHVPGPVSDQAEALTLTEIPEPKRLDSPRMAAVESASISGSAESASSRLGVEAPEPLAPSLTTTFDSTDFNTNSINTGGFVFIPPDPHGAAGPNHVVNVTNVTIRFHQKNGTLDADNSLASFFSSLSPVNLLFDPKVLYDQIAGRFVVVALEKVDTGTTTGNSSCILVAVSDDSNPNGTWFQTAINSKLSFPDIVIGGPAIDHFADYPGFAIDEEAVYITANIFGFAAAGGFFDGVRLWIVDKTGGAGGGFYGGGTPTVSGALDPYGPPHNCLATAPFCVTTQPAHLYGTAPASSVGTWLTLYSGLTAAGNESVQVMRVDTPLTTPTFVGPVFVPLGNIDNTSTSPIPDAPQRGSAETIETNDRRTLDAVWRGNRLYVTTTLVPDTGDPDAGQTTAHWIQLDTSNLVSGPSLVDQDNLGGEDIPDQMGLGVKFTFFPSVAVSSSNHIALGFSASGSSIFAGSYYTTILPGTAPKPNTGTGILRSGTDFYIRTFDDPPCQTSPARNRWGDYSGMALDPADQCFWVYNQHPILRGQATAGGCNGRPAMEDGRWGTAFGKFCSTTSPPANTPPVANNDSYATLQNTMLSVPAPGVLANDTDVEDGTPTKAVLQNNVSNGTLTLNNDGSFTYNPTTGFIGTDSFSYFAQDSLGANSTTPATVTLAVLATCPTTLNLSGLTITGPLTLKASSQITASTVEILSGGNLKLVAPLVSFDNGFKALTTSQLEVENGTCP